MIFKKTEIKEVIKFLKEKKYRIILLYGKIGCGKTTFVRNYLNNSEVTSPTFNICHQYDYLYGNVSENVFHFDLYRIEPSYEKLESINFFYAINNFLTFVEWSEKLDLNLISHVKKDICKIVITEKLFKINEEFI